MDIYKKALEIACGDMEVEDKSKVNEYHLKRSPYSQKQLVEYYIRQAKLENWREQ